MPLKNPLLSCNFKVNFADLSYVVGLIQTRMISTIEYIIGVINALRIGSASRQLSNLYLGI